MKWRENNKYHQDVHINFNECDHKGTMKLSSIMARFSDIAGEDYTDLGYSHDALWERNMVFLVSRLSIKIHENVRADEDVISQTYERGIKGAMYYRNHVMLTKDGAPRISAKSSWVLCDPVSRRILRPESLGRDVAEAWDVVVDCQEPSKLKMPDNLEYSGERRVVYSDMDANGHVYNAVYADIACDFLPFSMMERQIKEFSINFHRETKIGDILKVYTLAGERGAVVRGDIDGNISFACSFVF